MTPDDELTVTYSLTKADIERFVRYHTMHEQGRLMWAIYAFWVGIQPLSAIWDHQSWVGGVMQTLLAAILVIPFYRYLIHFQTKQLIAGNPTMLAERTRGISRDGVLEFSSRSEHRMDWSVYTRIVGTPEDIVMYRGRDMGEIIPRQAFVSPEAADRFLEAAREWHRMASSAA